MSLCAQMKKWKNINSSRFNLAWEDLHIIRIQNAKKIKGKLKFFLKLCSEDISI